MQCYYWINEHKFNRRLLLIQNSLFTYFGIYLSTSHYDVSAEHWKALKWERCHKMG